jgi:hypothetical protein
VPNDNPDWTGRAADPAIDLGAFTIPLNTLATVYNGATPAGCHALRIFVKSTDPTNNAQSVKVIDPSDGHVLEQFVNPQGVWLTAPVDDVTTPNIQVDILSNGLAPTTGRVVAFLSDQAVTVDNDPAQPVPVFPSAAGAVFPTAGTGYAFTQTVISAANTLVSLAITPPAGAVVHIGAITTSFSGATAGSPSVQVLSGATLVWEAQVSETAAGVPCHHFPFPDGGINMGASGATVTIRLAAAGAAGIAGCLAVVYGEFDF